MLTARTANVTDAFYHGTNTGLAKLNRAHPDRLRKLSMNDEDLSPEIFQIIYSKPLSEQSVAACCLRSLIPVVDLMDEVELAIRESKSAEGVDTIRALSKAAQQRITTARLTLFNALKRQRHYYRRLIDAGKIDIFGQPLDVSEPQLAVDSASGEGSDSRGMLNEAGRDGFVAGDECSESSEEVEDEEPFLCGSLTSGGEREVSLLSDDEDKLSEDELDVFELERVSQPARTATSCARH